MYTPNLTIDNSRLKIRVAEALLDQPKTYLTATATAGDSTLTVKNITGAAVSGYLVLGMVGNEDTELVQVHAVTAPSGSTITLTAAITYSHGLDTPVQFIPYNQVEFSRATSSGGAKSVLSTTALLVDQDFTIYNDTTNSTGYAYARFKNSTTTTYSEYSEEIAYPNPAFDSINRVIDRLYNWANEPSEQFISRKEMLGVVQEYVDTVNDLRSRWNHEEAAVDKSNTTTTGGETFTLPTDMKFQSDRSIIAIAIEGEEPLTSIGQEEWLEKIAGLARTTLNGAVSAGAATITVYDTTNFPDSGTAYIAGDTFTYTGTTATTLTGVSGVLDHDSGATVYEDSAVSAPTHYTLLDGTGYLYPAPDTDYDNRPLVIAYYKRLTVPNTENDVLPVPYVAPCLNYLKAYVQDKRGKEGSSEKYYQRFDSGIKVVIRNERLQPQYLTSLE